MNRIEKVDEWIDRHFKPLMTGVFIFYCILLSLIALLYAYLMEEWFQVFVFWYCLSSFAFVSIIMNQIYGIIKVNKELKTE